jgi:uncharacterized Tic20 family protein
VDLLLVFGVGLATGLILGPIVLWLVWRDSTTLIEAYRWFLLDGWRRP